SNPGEFDQRGDPFLRVVQGKQGGGVRIDMGAYERQGIAGTNFVVDTAVDESDGDYSVGDLSLREALGLANGDVGANTISFDPALSGATIALVLGQLDVTEAVTISGLGADVLTVDAQQGSRVLNIDDGDDTAHQAVSISGLTITGGEVGGSGAGIRSLERLELVDSLVTGNSATGPDATGGGIYLRMFGGMTSVISGSTIANNSSARNGGGLSVQTIAGDTLGVNNSTISGNEADLDGGGLWTSGTGSTNIVHSTIAFNTADANMDGTGVAGGIFDVSGGVTLYHTIVGSNSDPTGPNKDLQGTFTANFSLIGDTNGATLNGADNVENHAPLLAPLADYGGATPTHALYPKSPALDAGDKSVVSPPDFDQRGLGYERIYGKAIDIGAYELLIADGNLDGQVDGLDYLLWAQFYGDDVAQDPPGSPQNGDYNNDGKVDGLDYLVWAGQYGEGVAILPASQTASNTDEITAVDAAYESAYSDGASVRDWRISEAFNAVLKNKERKGT
ncbi:MAG: hypothetical protein KDA63_01345, partial [Planctomycetales bacterium]|nr:hypothetical protein [Planctomycetales bacterium]